MPVFNTLNEKLIELLVNNRAVFTSTELEHLLLNLIVYKLDGSSYAPATQDQRLLTLNKRLIRDYKITLLNDASQEVINAYKEEQKENPVEPLPEEKKAEVDMKEVEEIKTPYTQFLEDTEKYKRVFEDPENRKVRGRLVEMLSGVYALLQLNSGVRISELVEMDFVVNGKEVEYKQSKSVKNVRKFKPLFMTAGQWVETLSKMRAITGIEKVPRVTKRINQYLKEIYTTITKSHTLRKVYTMLSESPNPLGHKNPDMEKVYRVLKPKVQQEVAAQEVKEEVKVQEEPVQEVAVQGDKDKIFCETCKSYIRRQNKARHTKTLKHRRRLPK